MSRAKINIHFTVLFQNQISRKKSIRIEHGNLHNLEKKCSSKYMEEKVLLDSSVKMLLWEY